jgi:RNA polymerase sigma-70 factor (ECF subfamily)
VPDSAEGELGEVLSAFLRRLPDTERRLFMGRYWHGYAVGDLAAHYGLTPNAVTKRLGRTREKLRDYLNERGYGYETTNR